MNISYKTWLGFHDRIPEDRLGTEIAKLWKNDRDTGKTAKTPSFLPSSPREYAQVQSTSTELFLAQLPVNTAFEQVPLAEAGIAMFNADGYLIHLKGSESFMAWAKEHGITRKTRWLGNDLSTNAVSAGLTLQKPIHFAGWKNFGSDLFDISVSFAPIIHSYRKTLPYSEIVGGVGLIIPKAYASDQYLPLAVSLAQTVALTMWTTQFFMMTTSTVESAALTVYTAHGGCNIIQASRPSAKFFQSFHEELLYRELDTLISPLPKNESFWRSLNQGKSVKNQHMLIDCTNGATLPAYVSIEPVHIDALKMTGAQLFFKLYEDIAQEISPYLGKASTTLTDIVGISPAFRACLEKTKILSSSNSTVLITGESGTGKDLFAQALHNAGPRRNRPFIAVNCAALPRDLISSELFGYEAGAFTGANRNGSIGKFELANGGTLFLDEIGDLPLDLQATLLRAIEQKAFMRIGGKKMVSVDVRIIAATNADLHLKISQDRFREDLYYRLKTTSLSLPPLRKRQEDIPLLVSHFVRRSQSPVVFSEDALQFLSQLRWPGNVRQLQNIVEGFIQSNEDIDTVSKAHMVTYLQEIGELDLLYENPLLQETHFSPPKPAVMAEFPTVQSSAASIKSYIPNSREIIEQALIENHYHKQKTANQLGISKATLYRRMKEYGII